MRPYALQLFMSQFCTLKNNMFQILHPIGALMHTHSHGNLASAWRVRRHPITGRDEWTQLDRRDPKMEQVFQEEL